MYRRYYCPVCGKPEIFRTDRGSMTDCYCPACEDTYTYMEWANNTLGVVENTLIELKGGIAEIGLEVEESKIRFKIRALLEKSERNFNDD